jgi:hypothetical protein
MAGVQYTLQIVVNLGLDHGFIPFVNLSGFKNFVNLLESLRSVQ